MQRPYRDLVGEAQQAWRTLAPQLHLALRLDIARILVKLRLARHILQMKFDEAKNNRATPAAFRRQLQERLDEVTACSFAASEALLSLVSKERECFTGELVNTLPDTQHQVNFHCLCGQLLTLAQDIYKIYRNCVWTRNVHGCETRSAAWNKYKVGEMHWLWCTSCGSRVGYYAPKERLFKLFYIDKQEGTVLFASTDSRSSKVVDLLRLHVPLQSAGSSPYPRCGAQLPRKLEEKLAIEAGLPTDEMTLELLAKEVMKKKVSSAIELSQRNEVLQKELEKLKIDAEEANLCSICMTRPRSHSVDPCGHVYCLECIQSFVPKLCATCRGPIERINRLHL